MKIAFVGNTNCMPFRYAKRLKEMGHNVKFYITYTQQEKLHRPEFIFPDITYPYPSWIKENLPSANRLQGIFPKMFYKTMIDELNNFEFVVLNDIWHILAPYLNKDIIIFNMGTGTDIDMNARLDLIPAKLQSTSILFRPIKYFLCLARTLSVRKGLKRGNVLSYFLEGIVPEMDSMIEKIKGDKNYLRFNKFALSTDWVDYYPPTKKDKIILFSATRFLFQGPFEIPYNSWENKGNNIMLEGIAKFYTKTNIELDIHLVEKGKDVELAKQISKNLGIEHMITWHSEMSQANIIDWYKKSDILFDQLANHMTGFASYDPMLIGRPVIANGRPEVFTKHYGEPLPVCQASNSNEVCMWLEKLVPDYTLRVSIGKNAREVLLKNFDIDRYLESLLEIVMNLKNKQ